MGIPFAVSYVNMLVGIGMTWSALPPLLRLQRTLFDDMSRLSRSTKIRNMVLLDAFAPWSASR